jgi:hypothetical protein
MLTPLEQAVLRAPFPLYGLSDAFTDIRWVAQQDALPSHVVLGHGDPRAEPPKWVKVGVMLRDPGAHFDEYAGASIDIVDTLAGMHGAEMGVHLTFDETHAIAWTGTTLSVDGERKSFQIIGDAQRWIAYREEDETWLFVHSRRTPQNSIDLVRVDPEAYLSGSRKLGA